MNRLGTLIKKRLAEMEKNQRWLAKRVGVSEGAISKLIHGGGGASVDLLINIAEALGESLGTVIRLYTGRAVSPSRSPVREWIDRSLERLDQESLEREAVYLSQLADRLAGRNKDDATSPRVPLEGQKKP